MNKLLRKISLKSRKKKYEQFMEIMKPKKDSSILDVGFSESEYMEGANYLEKYYPYPEQITALGINKPVKFLERYPKVKTIVYDGRVFPFDDKSFDICWSNAVLEHVGNRKFQLQFIQEIERCSKSAFITTPNRFFPYETHTHVILLHYLPKRWFDSILVKLHKEWHTGECLNLLSLRDIKKLMREAGIEKYQILRNRFLFFTLNFTICW